MENKGYVMYDNYNINYDDWYEDFQDWIGINDIDEDLNNEEYFDKFNFNW